MFVVSACVRVCVSLDICVFRASARREKRGRSEKEQESVKEETTREKET